MKRLAIFAGGVVLAASAAGGCTTLLGTFDFTGTGGSSTSSGAPSGASSSGSTGSTGSTSSTGGASTASSSGSTAASSTSTSTATTSSTSTSSGTGGSMATCTSISSALTIMTPTDVGPLQVQQLFLVPDPGDAQLDNPSVHVVLVGSGGTQLALVRSFGTQGNGVEGPLVSLGQVTVGSTCTMQSDCTSGSCSNGTCINVANGFTPLAGTVVPGSSLTLYGNYAGQTTAAMGLGQISISLANQSKTDAVETSPAPAFTPWNTPADCLSTNNGGVHRLAITNPDSSGNLLYSVGCGIGPTSASLWFGSSDASIMPTKVATGMQNDALMNPLYYALVQNQHFVVFKGGDFVSSNFGYGSTPQVLASSTLGTLGLVTGQIAPVVAIVPDVANDAFALIAGSLPTDFTSASIWTGLIHPSDYATLGHVPPPSMTQIYSTNTVTDVGLGNDPSIDAKTIYAAGATLDQTGVRFNWLNRDGTPRIMEMQVHSTQTPACMAANNCNAVTAANAAPLGTTAVVVAWAEQTATTPVQTTVYGVKYLCH